MSDGGLRPLFRQHLPQFDWQSVETAATGGGVPDSNYCLAGCEGWIEFKQTTGWAVTLRPAQIGWIARRVRHSGRVLIAVRRRTGGGPRQGASVDQLWLLAGSCAREARTGGLRAVTPLLVAQGGPARWDWQAIGRVLVAY